MDVGNYNLLLDSLDAVGMGVYVIREDDHRTLYFNKMVKKIAPDAQLGDVCSNLWKGSCQNCPLIGMGSKMSNQSFNYDGPFHRATDIVATRTLWDGKIPAFIITFSPHAETFGANYDKIVRGNLTYDTCAAIKMDDDERAKLSKGNFTLTEALATFEGSGLLYKEDKARFIEFSNLKRMSEEFRSGKRIIVCAYRRKSKQEEGFHWTTMEVTSDVNYTDDSQSIMIYVKDVQNIYREGLTREHVNLKNEAILNALGKEHFGVYLVELATGRMDYVRFADEDKDLLNYKDANWDDVIERLALKRYHPSSCEKFRAAFNRKALIEEMKNRRDKGGKKELLLERRVGKEWHYVIAASYFHTDEQGREYAILAFQDADERVRNELGHIRNERRMAAVIRSSYSHVSFVDLETGSCEKIILDREGEEQVVRADYMENLRKVAETRVYGSDRGKFLQSLSLESLREKAKGVKDCREETIQYRVGNMPPFKWKEDHIFYICQENLVEVNIFGRDITLAKQHEEDVEAAKREKENIIKCLGGMFFSTGYIDLDSGMMKRIVQRDKIAKRLDIKESYAETIMDYAEHFVNEEDRDKYLATVGYEAVLRNLSRKHPIIACEFREKAEDGVECRWVRASVVLAEAYAGKPSSAIYVAQDITDVKQNEMRDREVLSDALEAAKFANTAKSGFMSRMSHDIRTPLNAIIGMTAIARAHLDERQRVVDCLSKITVSSKHLLSLINEVLDLSKIESGRVELSEEEFDLTNFFDELMTIVMPSVNAKKQIISCKLLGVEHEKLIGDPLRLQQVFTNILSNAVKYTQEGGRIELEIHELPSDSVGYARFEFIFRDNGIGMSEKYIKNVFEPFSREERMTSGQVEGTGLGLAIARNIVQMMNGDITLKSKENVGSEFTVALYLKVSDQDPIKIERLVELPVLVADDDRDQCETACHVINELGMKAEWVLSGQEAVEKTEYAHFTQHDYFAVILDWKMPGMDGIETARQIRARVGPDVPIIILSAYDYGEIEEEAVAAGVNGFISKPLFKSRLAYLFRKFIGEEKETANAEKELDDIGSRNFSGKKILLAEDNDLNREIATEIIGMTGATIECAVNGREAVEMFQKSAPGYYDLIFMDIQMPVMNGHEATEAIRRLPRSDAECVPIIAMSANAFTSDISASKRAGMNGHIIKPINFKTLTKCMDKWLNKV